MEWFWQVQVGFFYGSIYFSVRLHFVVFSVKRFHDANAYNWDKEFKDRVKMM